MPDTTIKFNKGTLKPIYVIRNTIISNGSHFKVDKERFGESKNC